MFDQCDQKNCINSRYSFDPYSFYRIRISAFLPHPQETLRDILYILGLYIFQKLHICVASQKLCTEDMVIKYQFCSAVFRLRVPYFVVISSVTHAILLSCLRIHERLPSV